mmetsp:Transcript_41895/g.110398  ORF Transcript_41895/g.110398 Transcript_41895/m.110398 type:complete len:278 (+) Transcript_41895:823-1656(+)
MGCAHDEAGDAAVLIDVVVAQLRGALALDLDAHTAVVAHRVAGDAACRARAQQHAGVVIVEDVVGAHVGGRLGLEANARRRAVGDAVGVVAPSRALAHVQAVLRARRDDVVGHLGVGADVDDDARSGALGDAVALEEALRVLGEEDGAGAAADQPVVAEVHRRAPRLVGEEPGDRDAVLCERHEQPHRGVQLLLLLQVARRLVGRDHSRLLATHLDVVRARVRDVVVDQQALPLGAHDHAAPLLVVDLVPLDVRVRALSQHDAILVLIDLVVGDRAA